MRLNMKMDNITEIILTYSIIYVRKNSFYLLKGTPIVRQKTITTGVFFYYLLIS